MWPNSASPRMQRLQRQWHCAGLSGGAVWGWSLKKSAQNSCLEVLRCSPELQSDQQGHSKHSLLFPHCLHVLFLFLALIDPYPTLLPTGEMTHLKRAGAFLSSGPVGFSGAYIQNCLEVVNRIKHRGSEKQNSKGCLLISKLMKTKQALKSFLAELSFSLPYHLKDGPDNICFPFFF